MRHLGRGVKFPTDPVTNEISNHGATIGLRVLLNRRADIANAITLPNLSEPEC